MKCPWCLRDIGVPYPSYGFRNCPYCARGITYAFHGRTASLCFCVGAAASWLLAPYIGGFVILLVVGLPLVMSAYLEIRF
jgi:hypothetical protein